jgi:hypothetical protein
VSVNNCKGKGALKVLWGSSCYCEKVAISD